MFDFIQQLLTETLDVCADFFRAHKVVRWAILFISPVLIIAGIAVRYFSSRYVSEGIGPLQATVGNAGIVLIALGGFAFVADLLSLTQLRLTADSLESELEPLRKEREELRKRLQAEPSEKRDVFDTIQLSLNQIAEYYTINKGQARSSFRSSVFATVVGLATLISGVWFFYFHRGNIQLAALSAISGLLVQFIGGAYFFLYNKSLVQLNFFFENLVKMQDTMLAVELCEQLENQMRDAVREKIIMALLERSRPVRGAVSSRERTSGGVLQKRSKMKSAIAAS